MLTLIFFYLVLPFLLAGLAIRFLKRHPARATPGNILAALSADPIERKHFRALRVDGELGTSTRLVKLGDFEGQIEAVDAVYQARASDGKASAARAYIVLNDKGDILQQI